MKTGFLSHLVSNTAIARSVSLSLSLSAAILATIFNSAVANADPRLLVCHEELHLNNGIKITGIPMTEARMHQPYFDDSFPSRAFVATAPTAEVYAEVFCDSAPSSLSACTLAVRTKDQATVIDLHLVPAPIPRPHQSFSIETDLARYHLPMQIEGIKSEIKTVKIFCLAK